MVWIHGGGFSVGSDDSTFYGPNYIVEKDVVLVTLNYRLGVLGTLLRISLIRNKLSFILVHMSITCVWLILF